MRNTKSDLYIFRYVNKVELALVFAVFVGNAAVDLLMTALIAASLNGFLGGAAPQVALLDLIASSDFLGGLYVVTLVVICFRGVISLATTYFLGSFTARTGERIRALIFADYVKWQSSDSVEDLIQNVQINVAGYVNGRLKQWLTILRDTIIYLVIVLGAGSFGGEEVVYLLIGAMVCLVLLRLVTMNILALVAKGNMDISYRITRFLRTFFLLRQEIDVFKRHQWAATKFEVENQAMRSWSVRSDVVVAFTRLLLETSLFAMIMGAIILVSNLQVPVEIIFPKLGILVVLSVRLLPLLVSISQCYTALLSSAPRAYRLYETLQEAVQRTHSNALSQSSAQRTGSPEARLPDSQAARVFATFSGCTYSNPADRLIKVDSFKIEAGDVICIVGPSGIGKSTLLSDLLGLSKRQNLPPQILDTRWQLQTASLGICPQFPEVVDGTFFENVSLGSEYDRSVVDQAFRKFKIAGELDDVVSADQLSGGERKKVGILRVLCCPVIDIGIFDEPSNALDAPSVSKFCSTMKGLSGPMAIILVSHDPRIIECANKVVNVTEIG